MAINSKQPNWVFYAAWVGLNILAIPLAFGGASIILALATYWIGDWIEVDGRAHITEDYLFSFVFPPLIWLFTSGLQYALLRRYLSKMGGWFPLTAIGWLLGIAILSLIRVTFTQFYEIMPFNAVLLAIVGASIGFMQWLLLRRRLPNAAWWIFASALGWGLIALIRLPFTSVLDILAIGLFPAVTTGFVWWFFWK